MDSFKTQFLEYWKQHPQGMYILLLSLLTLLAFSPVFNAGFIWDDYLIIDNPHMQSLGGLKTIWTNPLQNMDEAHYWPLFYTTYWLEYQVYGNSAFGFHFVNLLLHLFNSILLWQILTRLKVPGAQWAALIFAVHPVHVESVAWILERKDTLSAFFYLLCFSAYLKYIDRDDYKQYGLALLFFTGSLLSKSIGITLPVILLLFLWWKNDTLRPKHLLSILPFFVIGGIYSLYDMHLVALRSPEKFDYSFIERILLASRAVWFYAGKLFFPFNLMTIYPHWDVHTHSLVPFIYPLGLALVLLSLWIQRNRWGKGALIGAAFFLLTLSPVIGFMDFSFMKHSFVADRYQYLASAGIITVICAMLTLVYQHCALYPKRIIAGCGTCIVLIFIILTYCQSRLYENSETLFRDAIQKNPQAWVAYNNLATALDDKGEFNEAYSLYQTAIHLNPAYADPYLNLGNHYFKKEAYLLAESHYRRAIQLNPNLSEAYNNLGAVLAQQNKLQESYSAFQKALQINPHDESAQRNLVKLRSMQPGLK